ncbi:MFS transporter [Leifsonia shinshuensis]
MIDTEATSRRTRPLVLLGLSLGYFMVLLDTTIVTVALPAISSEFGGGLSALQWVANGYTLTFAAFLLTAGWFSDRFGARRVFLGGLAAFGLLSAITAAAPTLAALIVLRLLLGVAGAALLPSSLAVIMQTYAVPAERTRAIGSWAAVTGSALVCGPIFGGILVESLGWRAIFVVNIPLAVLSFWITARGVAPSVPKPRGRLDLPGQILAILGLGALVFALIEAPDLGWTHPVTVGAIAVSLICGLVFFLNERRHGDDAILPLRLFTNRQVSAAMVGGLLANFGLSGLLFVLSLYFQDGRHYSALITGLMFLPLTLPTAFNPILTGKIVARIGPKVPAASGMLLMAAGALIQAPFTGDGSLDAGASIVGLLLFGFGVSLTLPSLVAATALSVPSELAGVGAGALNSMRQVGASLGVALLGLVLTTSQTVHGGAAAALIVSGVLLIAGAIVLLMNLESNKKGQE